MAAGEYRGSREKKILFAGSFNVGKTTLINALLGTAAAPMEYHDWTPSTEILTHIRFGQKERALIHFPEELGKNTNPNIPQQAYLHMQQHGFYNIPPMEIPWEDREKYVVAVHQQGTIHRRWPYAKAELFVCSDLLRAGLEFVDTRGFVDPENGNEALLRELPAADTVVFLLDADMIELDGIVFDEETALFLQKFLIPAVGDNIHFVLNCDDLPPWQGGGLYREKIIRELLPLTRYGKDGIFFLSALEALNGKREGNRKQLEQSGILALEAALKALAEEASEPVPDSGANTADYFSWDNIQELTDMEGHIAFASGLVSKYDWSDTVRQQLRQQLLEIRSKQQDKKLNLSVIGEFSSGKSTFINALLRMDLLEACVLQGTTVASTILEYGKDYQIEILHKSGKKEPLSFSDFAQLKQKLNTIVAGNDAAQELSSVTVQLPSETLKAGKFRIIDTPGLNATVHWHKGVTIQALRQKSDLSIILVDAVRPLPDSLCEFISEHLEQVLDQCVFVVTKIDMIPPRERKRMLTYVEQVAKTRLGAKNPLVLPYASLEVINSFAPDSFPKSKYKEDAKDSFDSEARVMAHMAQQRAMVQARKLLSLVEQIYGGISEQMITMTEDYRRRLELLERSRQADLTEFVRSQKLIRTASFQKSTARAYRLVSRDSSDLTRTMRERIFQIIDQQTSTDNLNKYLQSSLAEDCQQLAVELCDRVLHSAAFSNATKDAFRREMDGFQDAFRQQFRKLNCLEPEFRYAPMPLPKVSVPTKGMLASAMTGAENSIKKEDRRILASAAAGAAVGTATLPVLGTLIGAGIGFFAGVFMFVDLDKMKEKTKRELTGPLTQYFDQVAQQAESQANAYINIIEKQIHTEIDRYLKAYRTKVDGWIAEEKSKRADLEHKVQLIQMDMHQIELRRDNLESVRRKMTRSKEA